MTPERHGMTDPRSMGAVLAAALLAALFVCGTWLAPLLQSTEGQAGKWLRLVYAPVCHQNPERCFVVFGAAQAVCTRCAGLYAGGVAGLFCAAWWVVARRRQPHRIWLALAVAPTVIDALLPWIGLPNLSNLPRHLLALPAGFVAGLFLAVGLADLFRTRTDVAPDRAMEPARIP